jgi:hypothetical protein
MIICDTIGGTWFSRPSAEMYASPLYAVPVRGSVYAMYS